MRILITYLSLFVFILSCKKDKTTIPDTSKSGTGELVFYIKSGKIYNHELPVSNASICLYESEDDRSLNIPSTHKLTTDTNGMAKFIFLDKSTYYVRVNHNNYGTLEKTVTANQKTIGYNTYVYP